MGARADKRQFEENARARQWQSAENQLAREHNQMLAEQQNKWNIEQWNRENEYNSPAAQMKRFVAAGLNPNALLGNMSNAPQLSGSLTSGQGYSPQDFSSTFDHGIADRAVSKGRNLSSAFEQLGEDLMQIPMYKEQVESARLDNSMKRQELAFTKFKNEQSSDPLGIDRLLSGNLPHSQREYLQGLQRETKVISSLTEDVRSKQIENALKSDTYKDTVEKIAADSKISKENADYIAKSAVYRLDADKYASELKELEMLYQKNQNEWMNWDRWINHSINAAGAVGDLLALKNLFKNIGQIGETVSVLGNK